MERLNFSFYDPIPTVAPPNDDLELQLVWLHIAEQSKGGLTAEDFARGWREHIHYMWDEYGRCRWNLRRGVPVESVGTFENPFHAGMGSPIRSEIWACLFPGDPGSAAHYAALDASLDHGAEGIAGEVLFAVMQSLIAAGDGLESAIARGLAYLPAHCETARAVQLVRASFGEGAQAWDCWRELLDRHGNDNFTHAPLNVALTIWALLYGEENFETSILLAVNGGYDTDCTAASVGATLGLLGGAESIPSLWSEPIGDGVFVGPGILGVDAPATLGELTRRTLRLSGKLPTQAWRGDCWKSQGAQVDLSALPGTIAVQPFGKLATVAWANGELPGEVKRAGGAEWTWHSNGEVREILSLCRKGARLFLDGKLVHECPPDLPYVPAPHRCPAASHLRVEVSPGAHHMRLELASREIEQAGSVILAYPNFHLSPWLAEELPHAARLPVARSVPQ